MPGRFSSKEKVALAFLLVLALTKFIQLNGGVVLGEPDESIHLEVLQNFRSGSLAPIFAGKGWYYNFPLFLYLGIPVSFVTGVNLLAYRLLSAGFSLFLTLALFAYFRQKSGSRLAFLVALLWSLCPFASFYARLGLIEMAVTSLMFTAFFAWDLGRNGRGFILPAVAGVLLGLAIWTKYTAFVFVLPLVVIMAKRSLVQVVVSVRQRLKRKALRFNQLLLEVIAWRMFLPLAIAGVMTLSLAFVFYLYDGFLFKLQAGASLGFLSDFWKTAQEGYWDTWWTKTAWWLGVPLFFFAMSGLGSWLWRRWRGGARDYDYLVFVFLVSGALITTRMPFNPRYFLPLVPFFCFFGAYGIVDLMGRVSSVWGKLCLVAIFLAGGFYQAGQNLVAYQASRHFLLERTGAWLKQQDLPRETFLFANWWPTFFEKDSGLERATWLATSAWETGAFVDSGGRSAVEILEREGGVVVLEELFSADLYHPPAREEGERLVRNKFLPVKVITDSQPNFPFYLGKKNQVEIYLVSPGEE